MTEVKETTEIIRVFNNKRNISKAIHDYFCNDFKNSIDCLNEDISVGI